VGGSGRGLIPCICVDGSDANPNGSLVGFLNAEPPLNAALSTRTFFEDDLKFPNASCVFAIELCWLHWEQNTKNSNPLRSETSCCYATETIGVVYRCSFTGVGIFGSDFTLSIPCIIQGDQKVSVHLMNVL